LIILEGFDAAILGVGESAGWDSPRVVYDYQKCLDVLMEQNNWEREDAIEWMDYNVINVYMGKGNPVFVFPSVDLAELAFEIKEEMLH
jgi:hypothetical protein